MADTIIYEQQEAVAIISINRPDSLNGFTSELCEELLLAFEKAQRDESVRAVVLTAEGRAFSAGADLKQGFVGDRTTQGKLLFEYAPVLIAIAEIPKPVIAAVPGFAAGIGMSFAMHCDLLVMAEGSFLLSPFTTISLLSLSSSLLLLSCRATASGSDAMMASARPLKVRTVFPWKLS